MDPKKIPTRYLFPSPSVQKGLEPEIKRGDFNFDKKLGEGAFGEVWKVIHKSSKKVYAMKQVLKEKVSRMLPQFKREVYIMYNLNHPHIIKILNHFEDDKSFYLLMEFADGGNLYHRLHRQRQFIEVEAAQYFREVVLAVEYLHSHNPAIIHRDIKPENILLDSNGRVKLTDFGWSNYESKEDEAPRKTVCGTLEYLPPEMIEEKSHDTTVDIWCLGVLLYEMLVGFTPFKSQTKKNMLMNISKNKPKFPLSFPPFAKDLIVRMLAKNSNERIKIGEVKEDRWLKEQPPTKDTVNQHYVMIPLPNYHDSTPLDFKSYEVVAKNEVPEPQEESESDDFELSSDESSTDGSEKLSTVFLEDLACKQSIKIMKQEIQSNITTLSKSKNVVNDTEMLAKELSAAMTALDSKVQAKKRELAYLANNEKEVKAHISDLDIQLSEYSFPSLVDDIITSIHNLKKDLSDNTLEVSVLSLKKETLNKEFLALTASYVSREGELAGLQKILVELKQSFTQTRREGTLQSSEMLMQADLIQSKKENHEHFTKALTDEDLLMAKDIKGVVVELKNCAGVNEDKLTEKISKIEEEIRQRAQDLVDLKINFEGKKTSLVQEGKRKKEEVVFNNKKSIEDIKTENKLGVLSEKESIREKLKKAREDEHRNTINEGDFERTKEKLKRVKERKEELLRKIQSAKIHKIKNKNLINDRNAKLELAKDDLNEMKVKYYCMQEGIEFE